MKGPLVVIGVVILVLFVATTRPFDVAVDRPRDDPSQVPAAGSISRPQQRQMDALTSAAMRSRNGQGRIDLSNSPAPDAPVGGPDQLRRHRRAPGEALRVLPIGDSLTRGVGAYIGYRYYLPRMLLQGGRPTYRIEYIGSQKSTCTPKRPNDPYHPSAEEAAVIAAGLNVSGMTDAAAPFWAWAHEGYCSRTAAGVAATIGEFLDKQRARDALTAQVDVVLMLIGHNDAFHAARRCKMREGHTLGPDETAAIAAYGQQQQQQSNPGADPIAASVSSSSASAPASGRLAVEAVLRHKAIRCVWHIIEGEFARDFALLLTAVILKTRPRAVLIGLNPPTGFPAIDEMLHAVIRRTVASYVASTDGADGSSGRAAIRLVAFPGFTRGAHTFDSTHPNAAGAQLLAEAWAAGIRGVFEG